MWTPGSQWLNAAVVKYEGGQIIPAEGGGELRGDGEPDVFPEHIIIDKPHPKLNIEVWNEGNDYEHDFKLDVVVEPVETIQARPIRELISLVRRALGI